MERMVVNNALRGQPQKRGPNSAPAPNLTREPSTSTTPVQPIFNLAWITHDLRQRSRGGISDEDLSQSAHNVLGQVGNLIGRPVAEVFEAVKPAVLKALLLAQKKHKIRVSSQMDTPLLGQFLVAVNGFIKVRNEAQLNGYLVLEPPFNPQYHNLIGELKKAYPKGNEDLLEQKCERALPAATTRDAEDGAAWTAFVKFMVQYLAYLRDIDADPDRYLQTYELLSELQSRANNALNHATLGHLLLPTVITIARLLCRLAIGLDKRSTLTAHLNASSTSGSGAAAANEDGGPRETLAERAANTLRQAFVICLNDRTPSAPNSAPAGKKRGIYTIANLCLKILFQCRKTRNATQIFENIYNLSPPLASYPKRERVAYLYYLGRFWFQNGHFYRAQLALQAAYDECPVREECVRQRRLLLIYLVASNLMLGRFPSQALLNRPEAAGLAERFLPLCHAIRKGDLAAFRHHTDIIQGEHASWFLHFRMLLQLRNRGEVLVWRSLVRKTWILNGTRPADLRSKVTPTVSIYDLVGAWEWLEKKQLQSKGLQVDEYIDPDFAGVEHHFAHDGEEALVDTTAIESILSSLIDQGFLGGFISHRQMKFAITGSAKKGGDILAAGFPRPWEVMSAKAEREKDGSGEVVVPGWKKLTPVSNGFGVAGAAGMLGGLRPGPGMVVNLSGARPVGAVG